MIKDDEAFGAEMLKSEVKPLARRQGKVLLRASPKDLNIAVRRQAAAADAPRENDPLHYDGIELLGPHDVVEYKQPGLQREVFKNLKQGRYDIGADLDLHNYRVEAAKKTLFQFVKDCMEQDVRCAIVVHGKGWHSSEGKGSTSRIKSHVVHWLKTMNTVQAFSSAQARDGGTGALYVLFKKSEKAKEENRRRFRPDEK